MRKNGDFAGLTEATPAFSGPDYLRAIFSLKRYSSMQGWAGQQENVRTTRRLPVACDSRLGAHAQAAE